MHIYFSGIGGAGIGPLAQVAKQAGYQVSGSDKQDSAYIGYLKSKGLGDIHISQTREGIAAVHEANPIDWFVYSSALSLENPDAPELKYCQEQGIKISKRDELLNQILKEKNLKLIAIAGTHGKTTTTAMVVYLYMKLGLPISYLLPAKTSFAEMGEYDPGSKYFIYEADEFDRNFLSFEPDISLISGVSWDHHEIFKTREDYKAAFTDFLSQSSSSVLWEEDAEYLGLEEDDKSLVVLNSSDNFVQEIMLVGLYNRLDARLAVEAVALSEKKSREELIKLINGFPGLSRRMERIINNLYSDYAHTPEKIKGAMSVAREMVADTKQKLVVVYEPLTNRRQHYIIDEYKDAFDGADKLYWVDSYLAREDPDQRIIDPSELIAHLSDPSIAQPMKLGHELKDIIQKHLDSGDMVVAMAGGGGGSLDDWVRDNFSN
ncbi:MAG TPA: Mur ligase domain-containing protein [Candidatus Sulfotelmatobacter sp.]|nr:Mur ligase domain-containing protein [Candidatus Sulfotelmatobacter sp.]